MEEKNKKNDSNFDDFEVKNEDSDKDIFGDEDNDSDDDNLLAFGDSDDTTDDEDDGVSKNDLNFDDDDNDDESNDQDDKESANSIISETKLRIIKKLLRNIKDNTEQIENLMSSMLTEEDEARIGIGQSSDEEMLKDKENFIGADKVIEGIFDGEKMIGPDGKQYTVPSNYASKSKLVEGDMMKLAITKNGTFVYKQIGPIDRSRIVGIVKKDEDGNFFVTYNNKKWRVLTASVTYFRGEEGDEAVILVPKNGESKWAAVENIINS